jgi:glyoxylase-like metal-dependent hydrolase (beta-lactamase superfamily II)
VIAKHFSALTMCPYGAFTLGDAKEMVCHCLVVETKHGLVVVDCGLFAEADFSGTMRTPGFFLKLMRVARDKEATAARQIEMLGYRTKDVRHVVCTHLDLDHAGGISDFPHASIHVMESEREAAESPQTRNERRRYIRAHFAHGPKWVTHTPGGERWNGFEAVRALADDEPDLLLVPLAGHTRGHAAVAVRSASKTGTADWLLHCGDAYFHRDEMTEKAKAPFGFELFQRTIATDDRMRRDNQRRLRELAQKSSDVKVFCAHSKQELESCMQGG